MTGSAAMMAIRVLLDHGVPAPQIIFCTFLVAADGGIHHIQEAFPGVRIVTGAVDGRVVEGWIGDDTARPTIGIQQSGTRRKVWNIEPGMGHVGAFLSLFDGQHGPEECLHHRRTLLLMTPLLEYNAHGHILFIFSRIIIYRMLFLSSLIRD